MWVDPTSGLQYEVVQVKLNRQRYIVVYRRRVSPGEVTGALDGPIHAEEVLDGPKTVSIILNNLTVVRVS